MLNAAKRTSKKRAAPTESTKASPQKKSKASSQADITTPFATEKALALPISSTSEAELSNIVLLTNRAPLVLAFAVCVLKYTMPEQPISSRLSLAQAVVSANSRSKAVSLGLESGQPAEQEGWGEGQPVITVLGRNVKVLKRWDYDPREGQQQSTQGSQDREVVPDDILGQHPPGGSESAPPFWGIDTEALKRAQSSRSNAAITSEKMLPIHTPHSARSYLLRSFVRTPSGNTENQIPPKKKSNVQVEAEKTDCLSQLLQCIDLVCRSWASALSVDELDRRAWAWYVHVRPSVQRGIGGWGEKGAVKLSEILALKRHS